MLEGVQILIDRMESNPEDFIRQPGYYTHGDEAPRFMDIGDALEEVLMGHEANTRFLHLTSEEKAALLVAYRKMMRQAFTAGVIAQVFGAAEKHNRLMVTPKRHPGFQIMPKKAEGSNVVYNKTESADAMVYKAEGATVAYFGSNGESMINPWDERNRTGAIGDKLRAAITKQPR